MIQQTWGKFISIAAVIAAVLALAGCSTTPVPTPTPVPPTPPPSPTPTPASAYPITLTDDAGRTVTIATRPQRIVSLAPSHTETLYALGLGDQVVGVTEYCNYPPEAANKPKIGGFANIDLEQVVGLNPDLVLASTLHIAEVVPALQERGLTVVVIEPKTVLGVLDSISTIAHITGQDKAGELLVAQMGQRIEAIQQKLKEVPRPKVFWELGPELYTAGPGSFINDLIVLAGGENVAADADSPWPQLSVEVIVLKDPDVIVLADHNYGETATKVKERSGWSDIRAVKEGRIVEITNDDIVSRPGPRIVEGLEFLARALHPDVFK